ncbi:hypothetical protein OTU49_015894, partial [Cherax quadricarinatus]
MQLLLKSKHREKGGGGTRGLAEAAGGGPGPSRPPSTTASRPPSRTASPVHEAANYHPDIVPPGATYCESPHHHHYHHRGHHQRHHHHQAWDTRPSYHHRIPHDLPDGVPDPRFTSTCPCGCRLSRASSLESECPPDMAESGCFPKGRPKHDCGSRSGRRSGHKEGRSKIRR